MPNPDALHQLNLLSAPSREGRRRRFRPLGNFFALAAALVLPAPAGADPGDDAAAYLARIAELDDAGPELNAVIVVNPNAPAEAR